MDGDNWYYSNKVKEHFFKPKNFAIKEPKENEFDAMGEVGNFACGDIMRMWIKIDPKTDRVKDLKWQTWGCATAIASTSAFSEMVLKNGGMKIENALKIKPQDIAKYLGGLPDRKFHCSVMADLAFKKAVENYRQAKNLTPS